MSCDCEFDAKNREQKGTLIILLLINGGMFLVELTAGLIADSTALVADSMDMLADAAVYSIALFAIGGDDTKKVTAASASGKMQILLGLMVLADIIRRALLGNEPEPMYMLVVGTIALIANGICLYIISAHRNGEIHMRASWIFSRNDVLANLGIIAGGVLVAYFGSPYPDFVIGIVIAGIVIMGGVRILRETKSHLKQITMPSPGEQKTASSD